jgi:hypothetical protein
MSWNEIIQLENFSDVTVYFVMASIGTLLFLIKLVLMLALGVGDADFDIDADGGLDVHGGGFGLFSMLSLLAFSMGAGWMGLACRIEFGFGPFLSGLLAASFGGFLMTIASVGMWQMKKMNQIGGYDARKCIGLIGQVYLRIPARGEGHGQVQINFDGRNKVLPAISTGEALDSFTSVKVVDLQGAETLIVERS